MPAFFRINHPRPGFQEEFKIVRSRKVLAAAAPKITDNSDVGRTLLRAVWEYGAPELIAFIIRKIP